MSDFAKEIISVTIEEELKQSYLDYAMSVIVGRALPDVRDGLKPVHRRVLFAMRELSNDWNKPYKKSARVVGDVIGKYHPHGELAVYDALVRLTQPFSMRYPLIDGQGNFGSVDGDSPAAMRYTEVRMSRLAHDLLMDLDKETVDFVPNYDGTEFAPSVMPTRVPNLLVNGSSGIAVGMATNIPPHNLNEVIDACLAVMDNPVIPLNELMQIIPGPDFPTSGIIGGREGIVEAYSTGRGRIYVRARTKVENVDEKGNKQALIITELPYQVNKANLIEKIAELVKEKKIEGITELRDESDKDGMRVVIELRRGEMPEVIENQLYSLTQMQTVFGINMVALIKGKPRLLNLVQILQAFIQHRREIITRRSIFELKKARERAHVLEGLGVALANIEEMIALIKSSKDSGEAKIKLLAQTWSLGIVAAMLERVGFELCRPTKLAAEYGHVEGGYRLSPEQAQAILDLRLHRLTSLEQEKILAEYQSLAEQIRTLLDILTTPEKLFAVLRAELLAIKEQYGDARRTEIVSQKHSIQTEDLITDEAVVVTVSRQGYAKIQALEAYQAQHRGGRGKSITDLKDDDYIEHLLVAMSHDMLLCFSNFGKVYWLKAYELPPGSRLSRGKPMVNILPFAKDERISAILPLREYAETKYAFMATEQGVVKKVCLQDFSRPRSNGIIALGLNEGDRLIGVTISEGNDDLMLLSDAGKAVRFNENAVRVMGRTARGVRGMRLKAKQKVISLMVAKPNGAILTVTENGYGKRTPVEDYRITSRGGQGVISIQVSERNGPVVAGIEVFDGDEVLLITNQGTAMRTTVAEISLISRNTQGVRLINLTKGEKVVSLERIAAL